MTNLKMNIIHGYIEAQTFVDPVAPSASSKRVQLLDPLLALACNGL